MSYVKTTGAIAQGATVSTPTVALYAKKGWLDFITASNGTRLFQESAVQRVRDIYLERMAKRGKKTA